MNKWQTVISGMVVVAMVGSLPNAMASPAASLEVPAAATTSPAIAQLPERIRNALLAANLPSDSVSIVVQPLGERNSTTLAKPVIAYQSQTPRTPASTQKLIPTYVALDSLGKDFRWRTELWLDGLVVNGVLYGDVIVKGGGDPKLEDDQVAALIGNLRHQGIHKLAGNVIVDTSVFRDVSFDINGFDGQGMRPYNAMPNGMLVNFGTLHIALVPNTPQQQALTESSMVTAVPAAVKSRLEQQAIDQHEAQLLAALRQPTTSINGQLQASSTASVAVPNLTSHESQDAAQGFTATATASRQPFDQYIIQLTPTLGNFEAPTVTKAAQDSCRGVTEDKLIQVTREALNFLRVPSANCGSDQQYWVTYPDGDSLAVKTVAGKVRAQFPDFSGQILLNNQGAFPLSTGTGLAQLGRAVMPPRLVAVHQSAPLGEQISDINHHSNNVMTEQIALSLPVYAAKQPYSTYPAAFGFIQSWWQQHLPTHTPPVMTRASGLCRDCRVTPDSLVSLLVNAYHSPNFDVYRTSLPIAGVSGTMKHLKDRDPTNPAIGRGWIKTGTLDTVASMAGYIQAKSGRWYAVVAMINAPNTMYNVHAKAVLDNTLAWTAEQ